MPLDTVCGDVPLTAMLPDDAESYNTLTFCVPALQLALLNRRNRTVPERFALLPDASLPLIVAVSWIVKVCTDEIFGRGFTTLASLASPQCPVTDNVLGESPLYAAIQ